MNVGMHGLLHSIDSPRVDPNGIITAFCRVQFLAENGLPTPSMHGIFFSSSRLHIPNPVKCPICTAIRGEAKYVIPQKAGRR